MRSGLSERDFEAAVAVINSGGIVAFPTETFYGLAVDSCNHQALERLFAAKQRPPERAILNLVGAADQVELLASSVPAPYLPLMRQFWPGPLTLIFPARSTLSPLLTGDTTTVGIRVSSHPVAAKLQRLAGKPITATSANRSGLPAAVQAGEAAALLRPDADFLLDGGPAPGPPGSTIVAVRQGKLILVRRGAVSVDRLREICDLQVPAAPGGEGL